MNKQSKVFKTKKPLQDRISKDVHKLYTEYCKTLKVPRSTITDQLVRNFLRVKAGFKPVRINTARQ